MILITGATGQVGGEVLDALVAAGTAVRAFVRNTSALRSAPSVTGPADHRQGAFTGRSPKSHRPGFLIAKSARQLSLGGGLR